jgi:hypothetical protein
MDAVYVFAAVAAVACHHVKPDPCWHPTNAITGEGTPRLQFRQEVSPGVFAGAVVDSVTQRPIAGVQIVFPVLRMGATTDSDGAFRINNLPVGRHALRIRKIGYYQISDSLTVTASAGIIALYSLAIDLRGVCEVTVTSRLDQARHLTNVAADKHVSDAASPQW